LQAAERKIAVAGIVFDFIRHDVAAGFDRLQRQRKETVVESESQRNSSFDCLLVIIQ